MEIRSLIKRCFCYSSVESDPIAQLRSRWLSLIHMLRAKYLDLTERPAEKLTWPELLLSLLRLLDSDGEILEDLNMIYMLSPWLIKQFLPQLSKFVLTSQSETAKNLFSQFILAKCQQSANFAYLAFWEFSSMLESSPFCKRKLNICISQIQAVSDTNFRKLEATGGTYTSDRFFNTIYFVKGVTDLALTLQKASSDTRHQTLQLSLEDLGRSFLPDKNIILPFKGHEDRYVFRIYREYSFPISTKERVPYVIVLGTKEKHRKKTLENQETEVIEQRLISRSLKRMDVEGITPEMANSFYEQEKEDEFHLPSSPESSPRPYFFLRSKPKHLFGSCSLEEIENYVQNSEPDVKLLSLIVKANDDIRQEQFASQLVYICKGIFAQAKLPLWLKDFAVVPTSSSGGLIETIHDAISIDRLKKSQKSELKAYFLSTFGPEHSDTYKKSMDNFVKSLAGYSLFCYLFAVKDRHNGNILIDSEGHLIHIDFGFMLSNSPGAIAFESSFKLSSEILDVIGGCHSRYFYQFQKLMVNGFFALRNHQYKIEQFLLMTQEQSYLPCFAGGNTVNEVNERLKLNLSKSQCRQFVCGLITQACDNWRTRWYDKYQQLCVGIW